MPNHWYFASRPMVQLQFYQNRNVSWPVSSGSQPFLSRGPLDCHFERPWSPEHTLKSLAPEIKVYFITSMVRLARLDMHCDVAPGFNRKIEHFLHFVFSCIFILLSRKSD